MISLTLENFRALTRQWNLIPVFKEIDLDYDNPLSILKKISSKKHCFLLESSAGPEKWSQYSFLGFDPTLIISSDQNQVTIKTREGKVEKSKEDIFLKLKKIMQKFNPVKINNLPRFYGGLVGFFSYEIINQLESNDYFYIYKSFYNQNFNNTNEFFESIWSKPYKIEELGDFLKITYK